MGVASHVRGNRKGTDESCNGCLLIRKKNFNYPKDGLHLTKLGVQSLSAILLKTLYCPIRSE